MEERLQSSEEALQSKLKAARTWGGKQTEVQTNATISQNILHGDLGYHSDTMPDYSLSDGVRDRLLAHARQDASLAALQAASTLNALRSIKRLLWAILIVCATILFYLLSRPGS